LDFFLSLVLAVSGGCPPATTTHGRSLADRSHAKEGLAGRRHAERGCVRSPLWPPPPLSMEPGERRELVAMAAAGARGEGEA
jgi:hypothetical protein